jgi:hypothetical protein
MAELLLLLSLKAFLHALARYAPLRMLDVFSLCTAAEPAVAIANSSNSQLQTAPRQTRPLREIVYWSTIYRIPGDCPLLLFHVTAL